jgi:hypothetical protein
MKKDLQIEEVKDIAIAIVPDHLASESPEWSVYFLNLKEVAVSSVFINAEARGVVNGEEKHTAILRFFLKDVEARSYKKFELIMPDTFALNNQYWVSFYENEKIFDKKYLFAANSISQDRLVNVPLLDKPGVIIM